MDWLNIKNKEGKLTAQVDGRGLLVVDHSNALPMHCSHDGTPEEEE